MAAATVVSLKVLCALAVIAACVAHPRPVTPVPTEGVHETSLEPSHSIDQEPVQTQLQADYDDSDMYMEQQTKQTQISGSTSEPRQDSQNFYPFFSLFNNQPLGHSRPFYQQEAAFSQRPITYNQQLQFDAGKYVNNPFRRDNFQVASDNTQSILGSGNFGVIRGGTFYTDNDEQTDYSHGRYVYNNPRFYNNGHGRPAFYYGATNPRPQQHEQFANFRDFADINTPTSPDFSQYVVVYINKNGTKVDPDPGSNTEPKNIIERLAMLDQDVKPLNESPDKKLSKSKRKLALLSPEKKTKPKSSTSSPDLYEPLLALS